MPELLIMLLSERFGVSGETGTAQRSAGVEAMREKILNDMQKKDDPKKDLGKKAKVKAREADGSTISLSFYPQVYFIKFLSTVCRMPPLR